MTDLFANQPKPESPIGKGNALALADLANGASTQTMRNNWKAGKYDGALPDIIKANLAFLGRTTK